MTMSMSYVDNLQNLRPSHLPDDDSSVLGDLEPQARCLLPPPSISLACGAYWPLARILVSFGAAG